MDQSDQTKEAALMLSVGRPQLHHIALTVTDIDASVTWYEDVFRLQYRVDVPHEGGMGSCWPTTPAN